LHARRILRVYQSLEKSGEHLLRPALGRRALTQWAHYPRNDAVDTTQRYQWYYHSHTPADRPAESEHGHFHLFARINARRTLIAPAAEAAFLRKLQATDSTAKTRHLLAIGMNPVGVPISLFTVNRWVTGDQLLSSASTLHILETLKLDSGYPHIDRLLSSLIALYMPQLRTLFRKRDQTLFNRAKHGPGTLDDESLEILSELKLNLDRRIVTACRPK
jgi:hypothetical protein